jgi:hypothetical protein
MARRLLSGVFALRLRRGLAIALGHSDLAELLLTLPRLWRPAGGVSTQGPLIGVLLPFRRWLWRQRALVLLARATLAGSAYLVVSHFLLLRLSSSVPNPAIWAPALLILLIGIWLSVANRPSLQETAYWLDHRFDLREQLGTALEQGANVREGSLAARQVGKARELAATLPDRPMEVRQQGPWALAAAVALIGVLSMVIPGNAAPSAEQAYTPGPDRRALNTASTPIAQLTPSQQLRPRAPLRLPAAAANATAIAGNRPVATSQPLLSSSLQIKLGPASAENADASGAAPQVGNLSGSSSKTTKAPKQEPSSGSSSQSQQQSGASNSTRPQSSSQKGGNKGTGQGQQGPSNNSSQQQQGTQQQLDQGAQNLPNQAPSGSSAGSQSSQGQDQTQSQSGRQSSQPPGQQGGNPQANPFGADPSAPKSRSSQPPPGNSTKIVKPGQSTSGSPEQHGSTGTQQGNSSGSGDNSPDGRPYNRSGTSLPSSPDGRQPGSSGGKSSGLTHTATIQVQGKATIGSGGGQGPDLVRVIPYGAEPGEALQGPASSGQSTVEGYVPEQSIILPPDEQALVQSYFSNGSGS